MLWVFNMLAILLTLLVGFLYNYGLVHGFFWHYSWYDSPLHVLSGMVIGLWASAVALRMRLSVWRASIFMLLMAVGVGFAWESLELWTGLTSLSQPHYILDTTEDIFCDIAGATVIAGLYWSIYRRKFI